MSIESYDGAAQGCWAFLCPQTDCLCFSKWLVQLLRFCPGTNLFKLYRCVTYRRSRGTMQQRGSIRALYSAILGSKLSETNQIQLKGSFKSLESINLTGQTSQRLCYGWMVRWNVGRLYVERLNVDESR